MKHKKDVRKLYKPPIISIMELLIIFPVILQTVINLIMLSIGGQGLPFTTIQPES